MNRQVTNQGGSLPKTDAKVSAVGMHVARFRHWCKGHWPVIEAVLGTAALFIGGYVTLVLVIGFAPVNR